MTVLRVALTGGIASGKSTVAKLFAARQIPVIDADVAARAVVAPGSTGLQRLVAAFGARILQADGQLDRTALREIIFSDAGARHTVNQILHPLIREWMRTEAQQHSAPLQLFVIPLLAETDQASAYDYVITVEAPHTQRLARLMRRDGVSETAAEAVLHAQADDAQRRDIADHVIHNDADEATLAAQVESLHHHLLTLSRNTE